jgi:hypothetical protein
MYPFTEENIANAKPVNWDVYAEKKDQFIERWGTEIETK